jgi:hypothetical protein
MHSRSHPPRNVHLQGIVDIGPNGANQTPQIGLVHELRIDSDESANTRMD